MLFANISADKIHCIVDGEETFIEHGDLEKTIAAFLHQQNTVTKAFVINGPGSFTNLRIATLALNMYNFLHKGVADYYTIDKISLYKKLYEKKIIPRIGYIYIGQRKNRRKIDLESMHHDMVQEFDDESAFVDEIFEWEKRENMVHFSWEWDALVVYFQGGSHKFTLDDLGLEAVKMLEANYMMEPNVTIKEYK